MGEPPVNAGAVNSTVALAGPGVAAPIVGAPGITAETTVVPLTGVASL